MTLLVVGANGRTGKHVVKHALDRGHSVKAFVRRPESLNLSHPKLDIVQGDVLDPVSLDRAMEGVEAVISALGHSKNTPDDMQARGTQNIVDAMEKHGIKRIVSMTGAGVHFEKDQPKFINHIIKFMLKLLQKRILVDAENHATILRNSGMEWTLVRGPMLHDGLKPDSLKVGYVGTGPGPRLSRENAAVFMLDAVEGPTHLYDAPALSD